MKKPLLAVAGVALIVAVGVLAYPHLFGRGDSLPTWTLATYSGGVEVSLAGAEWVPADMKMLLTDRDRVRTGDDGEATLLSRESHVTVRPLTQLEVSHLTRESSRFQVAAGHVLVEARGDRISMHAPAGAHVDAENAGLGMIVKEDGFTQVQVRRGEADFTSMNRTERVHEGEVSEAEPGRPPTAPVAIPQVILLNVRFPDADTFNSRLARIEGKADPGSRVWVGGRYVPVDRTGEWTADLELEEGINQIEVKASDALGRSRTERSSPIRVDTEAPPLDGAIIGSRAVAPAKPR